MYINSAIFKVVLSVGSAVLGILFAGNLFFINRLVTQLDVTSEIVRQLRQEVVVLRLTVDNFPDRQRIIRTK